MGNPASAEDRERHLELLATAFFEEMQYGCDFVSLGVVCGFGLGTYPIASQGAILRRIGVEPSGRCGVFTDEQLEYAQDLFEDLRQFLITKWRLYLELKGQHDSIP